ncbi:MAG TPA: response regulator [Desulfobacterales bacterium]|nr:response regulator [Desulfobacterales bacterium]
MLGSSASTKGLELTIHIPDETCLNLKGDPTRIQQVLTNLVANAIKFTENGDVAIRVATIKEDNQQVTLQIAVEDTGIGIGPEVRQQLFKPFSQADGSTTRKYGGTGLGLAISSELVSRMGGVLECVSEPGKGSHFFFTLQFEPVPETEGQEDFSGSARNNYTGAENTAQLAINVLVAEDNATNREVIFGMLKRVACKVTLVSNGREAVDSVSATPCDLILMDCQMPVMDGYQATAAIRRREEKEGRRKHIPIIALTANALEGDKEKCLIAGMDDYISKPFKQDDIDTILARWSHGKHSRFAISKPVSNLLDIDIGVVGPSVAENLTKAEGEGVLSVDLSVLSELRKLQIKGKPDILEKIVHVYLSSSEPLIQKLHGAAVAEDMDELQRAAHSIKSSSANVGAIKLSEMCKDLEMECRKKTLEDMMVRISAVEAEFLQVKHDLNRVISGWSASQLKTPVSGK